MADRQPHGFPIGAKLVNTMRYKTVLRRDPDGGYVVTVPALPGCVSQGETREEALTNVRAAIVAYVADCRDAGDPVPSDDESTELVDVDLAD